MAFSNTVTKQGILSGGIAFEEGTWNGASVTTGTITAAVTAGETNVGEIKRFWFSSDGDTAVLPAQDVDANKIKITFTSSDTGKYRIEGPAK